MNTNVTYLSKITDQNTPPPGARGLRPFPPLCRIIITKNKFSPPTAADEGPECFVYHMGASNPIHRSVLSPLSFFHVILYLLLGLPVAWRLDVSVERRSQSVSFVK